MKRVLCVLTRAAMSALLLSSSSGCSFIFVKPPTNDGGITTRVRSWDCTRSALAPGFDTAFGALQVVRTGMAATADKSTYSNPDAPLSREADIALGATFTALFVSSAIYGFVNTSRCRRLQQETDQPQPEMPGQPETWGAAAQETRSVAPPPTPTPAAEAPPPPAGPPPASEPSATPEQPSSHFEGVP